MSLTHKGTDGAVSPGHGGGPSVIGAETESDLATGPRRLYPYYLKPALDRLIGLTLLVGSIPVVAISALIVRIKLGSPVIYRQVRVGKDGEEFELLKLRTMIPDRRQASTTFEGLDRRQVHKSPDDPRVLPAGRTLRAWRLDELPQLWNVVIGNMSLVGPRPELPEIVAQYEDWQHQRHAVKPGITGPWQVSARNGKLMHECTELDLEYLDRITFRHDFSLLVSTPFAMIGQRRGF